MTRYLGRRLLAGAGLGMLAVVGPLASGAGAHTRPSSDLVPVGHGVEAAALPGATVFGTTPADTPESVSFILQARQAARLKATVEQGGHPFLTVSQFAQSYGQSPSSIYALELYLSQFGIETTSYADGLDVAATGTAGQFDQALAVQQFDYHVPGRAGRNGSAAVPAQTVHSAAAAPELPARIARSVLTVLGLTDYAPFTSHAVQATPAVAKAQPDSANSCIRLSGLPDGCHLPTDFEADYGLTPLAQSGATGAGETVGIVTLAALDPTAPAWFWKHELGLPAGGRTVTVDNVDGGSGPPSDASGTGETDLDVEQAGGVAPGADVVVYQAPNTDNGFADGFFTAASQNVADSVSSSWGESETYLEAAVASGTETPAYEAAFDEAFLELAMQGQSAFAAAGDSGAYDASGDLGSTNLSVDTPADSPFITAAGGTTLPWSGTVTGPAGTSAVVNVSTQRTWGWDYLWPALATSLGQSVASTAVTNVAGGGGGYSAAEPRPSYQQSVPGISSFQAVANLTPTDVQNDGGIEEPTAWTYNSTPKVVHGHGSGRAVPDLSADADPFSGYLLYEPSWAGVGQPVLEGGWGGTSFVAPQLNGAVAVIDSSLGHRIGFLNPIIYPLASSAHSPLTPLDQTGPGNDNVFYTGTAGAVYNPASGLGTPDFSQLAADLRG
jgi:subtilase family serine protease